jgi:hypothetical protein
MAEAARSLSPKRQAERMQRFCSAVMTIAVFRAKKAVQAQIRARGQKIAEFTAREISLPAKAELERNREKATADVATFPEFAGLDIASVWKSSGNRTLLATAATISGQISND